MPDRLYRSRRDRMLAGVAGGLAGMWDADPSLVRIVWALLVVFTGGIALIVYIVMAIVVPEEEATPWPPALDPSAGTADPSATRREERAASRGRRAAGRGDSSVPVVFGGLLIAFGGFFLIREFLPDLDFDWFGPAVLIALGVLVLITAIGRGKDDSTDAGGTS